MCDRGFQKLAWLRSRQGQGMVEYALILVLVAIVVIVVLTTMGQQISKVFQDIVNELNKTAS